MATRRRALPAKSSNEYHNLSRAEASAQLGDKTEEEMTALHSLMTSVGCRFDIYPILLSDGAIIDGWHRYQIAKGMGYEFSATDFKDVGDGSLDMGVEEYALREQLSRRNLSATERAKYAADFMGYAPKGTGKNPNVTAEMVAEMAGVSTKTLQRALSLASGKAAAPPKPKKTKVTVSPVTEIGEVDRMGVMLNLPPVTKDTLLAWVRERGEELDNQFTQIEDAISDLLRKEKVKKVPANVAKELESFGASVSAINDSLLD